MIQGKAIARFGNGDILVTPLVKKDSSNGCLVLQNQSAHAIGEYERNFGQDWNDTVFADRGGYGHGIRPRLCKEKLYRTRV